MIELKELKFGYKRNKLLFEELDAFMDEGKIYGLLGHNGAGKTTMLKLMSGLLFPKSGECNVMGFKPESRNPHFLQEIFYIPEEFDFPAFTIDKFVKVYSVFYPKFKKEILHEILHDFDLLIDHKLNAMSYGQKKKFLLAFAISTDCKILLMDEPTNGLDIPSKSKFRRIVAKYITDERIFIISTHQVRDLDSLLDSVMVVEKGKVIFNRSVMEIQEKMIFKRITEVSEHSEVVYSEKELGGYNVIAKNSGDQETKLDLELLYNAINADKVIVNNVFN